MEIVNDIYHSPVVESKYAENAFAINEIAFVNTNLINEPARFFKKHGVYTKLHPKYDKREYQQYWDLQEKYCRNGIVVPGKLYRDTDGDIKIQQVHITGDHYFYLNFCPILLSDDSNETNKGNTRKRAIKNKQKSLPDFWDGDYYYFHALKKAREMGKHLCVGKARRKGYSYKNAAKVAHNYNFFPNLTSIVGAFDMKYLTDGDGTMTMVKNYIDHIDKTTDWRKRRIVNRTEEIKSGFRYKGDDATYGFQSKVIAVSFGPSNPNAAIGKDASLILAEEAGKFPNLQEMLDVTLPTLEDGSYTTGQIVVFGTGGTKDANWEPFERLFYKPRRSFMTFENIWDDNKKESACSYFVPHSQNLKGFMDEDGNSLKKEAQAYAKKDRELEEKSSTPEDFHIYCGQRAEKPSEAFSRGSNNIFSSPELIEHSENLNRDDKYTNLARLGFYVEDKEGVRLMSNSERESLGIDVHPYLDKYPLHGVKDLHGCIAEWDAPFRIQGRVPSNRYRIWNDPYAHDKNAQDITMKDSLGAAYVYDTEKEVIVAEWVGRPADMDFYNTQLFLLAKRYNAKIMFENDRGDVKPFAKSNNLLEYLCEEPEFDFAKELSGKLGRGYGMHMTTARIGKAAVYLKNWLNEKVGEFDNGKPKLRLHYIYSYGLTKELLNWNLKGNFDRVSALLIGMFDRREILVNELSNAGMNTQDRELRDFFDGDYF